MQAQHVVVPQSDKPVWETPELVQSDISEVTLSGGAAAGDGVGTFS